MASVLGAQSIVVAHQPRAQSRHGHGLALQHGSPQGARDEGELRWDTGVPMTDDNTQANPRSNPILLRAFK
jgi:hypothetical protein